MSCVSTLGLKSLGQALKLSRDGVQMSAAMNTEQRRLLGNNKIPSGWESASIDKIDDVVILAKEGGSIIEPAFPEESSLHPPAAGEKNDGACVRRMVAQFRIHDLIGSIISWHPGDVSERPDIRYGIVLSTDIASEKALIRTMPMLSGASSGSLDALFQNSSNDMLIHATNVGASIWMPLSHVRFVSGKPSKKHLIKFSRKLKSRMSAEKEKYSNQIQRDAKFREEFTVELEDKYSEPPMQMDAAMQAAVAGELHNS